MTGPRAQTVPRLGADSLQLFPRMPFRAKRHNTGFSSYGYYEIAVSVFQRMRGEEVYIQDFM